jgi:3-mercaptopyruvate sulfurtransferase SseA
MRLFISCTIALIFGVVLLSGCNSDDSKGASKTSSSAPSGLASQTPSDGVARITVAELKVAVDKGTVFIIDTRGPEAYEAEHIKGSINMPETTVTARASELPRDKMIVAYCS